MRINYLPTILFLFLIGCTNEMEKSDAFGNFESESIIISSETGGKIIQFTVDKGQEIESNFIVAVIDTIQLKLRILQTEAQKGSIESRKNSVRAQINVFKEQKKNLNTNKERITNMLKDGAATQKQLDDLNGQINVIDKQITSTKTQFTSIEKELQVIDAQIKLLIDQMERCVIKSPMGGTILETYAEKGELTTPGKALVKMANLEELILKVYISGSQLQSIELGQEVEVIIDKSEEENKKLKGLVQWISPEAEFTPKIIQTKEERVKLVYAVKIAVKNDGTLKIGMPGEIVID